MKSKILNVSVCLLLFFSAIKVGAQDLSIKQCHPEIEFKLKSCKATDDVCVITFTLQNNSDRALTFNSMWRDPIVVAVDDEGYSYKSAYIEKDMFDMDHYVNTNAKITCEIVGFGFMGPAGCIGLNGSISTEGALLLEAGEKVKGKITIYKVDEESSKFKWIKFYVRNRTLRLVDRPIEIENLPIQRVEDE